MCGRTVCSLAPDDIVRRCTYHQRSTGKRSRPVWREPPGGQKFYPSHNIAPSSHTPILFSSKHYGEEFAGVTDRVIQPMKWGLTPSWHKGDPYKIEYETNNCRSEGMLTKQTYKVPLEKGRRCVVLAEGFFEWKRNEKVKQPYYIYFPKEEKKEDNIVDADADADADRLLTMAGVFDIWTPPDGGEPLYTYSIITVEASSAMSWIHHRMPAILQTDEEIREWLDYENVPLKKAVETIHPIEHVIMHPVSSVVNNSRNNTPECVKLFDPKKPKQTAASNFMMSWLGKSEKNESPCKDDEPPLKKVKP